MWDEMEGKAITKWNFPSYMGVPHFRMVYDGKSDENPNLKWMITRGTPISGKLQIQGKISSVGTDEVGNLFVFRDSCHGQIQLGQQLLLYHSIW